MFLLLQSPKRNRSNFRGLLLLLVALFALVALSGCRRIPEADMSGGEPPAGAPSEGEGESEQNGVGKLNVRIVGVPERICIGQDLEVSIEIEDAIDPELLVDTVIWTAAINDGGGADQKETPVQNKNDLSLPVNEPERDTKLVVLVEVGFNLVDLQGEEVFTAELQGAAEQPAGVESCDYNVRLLYDGNFMNLIWDQYEVAITEEEIRLSASDEGTYSGKGKLTYTMDQTGNTPAGPCENISSFTGAVDVEVDGHLEDDNLLLSFNFTPTTSNDAQMICNFEGESVTLPATGWPINPNHWRLSELEFPTAGGSKDVAVTQGYAGGSGSAQVTIVVELARDE